MPFTLIRQPFDVLCQSAKLIRPNEGHVKKSDKNTYHNLIKNRWLSLKFQMTLSQKSNPAIAALIEKHTSSDRTITTLNNEPSTHKQDDRKRIQSNCFTAANELNTFYALSLKLLSIIFDYFSNYQNLIKAKAITLADEATTKNQKLLPQANVSKCQEWTVRKRHNCGERSRVEKPILLSWGRDPAGNIRNNDFVLPFSVSTKTTLRQTMKLGNNLFQ